MLLCVRSSLIPTENEFIGWSFFNSSKTPLTIPGVNSLEESPNRPPTTTGWLSKGALPFFMLSKTTAATSL